MGPVLHNSGSLPAERSSLENQSSRQSLVHSAIRYTELISNRTGDGIVNGV